MPKRSISHRFWNPSNDYHKVKKVPGYNFKIILFITILFLLQGDSGGPLHVVLDDNVHHVAGKSN